MITHNADGPDFAVATSPVDPTPVEDWEPLVPHDPAVRIEDVDAFATHLVVSQRSEGLSRLRVLTLDEAGVAEDFLVPFEQEVYTVGLGRNSEFDTPVVRLGFGSLAVPSSVYDFDVATRSLALLRRTPVLGGFSVDDLEEHRLWATAPDGEQVPISLVVRRDARAQGAVPTLLYGYGSYEASMDPSFSVARLSLLDRGAAFAIAHVRGGGEMGRRWYDDGKILRKQNTFTDFAACARHLLDTGWSSTLVAEGASAGGLLMGGGQPGARAVRRDRGRGAVRGQPDHDARRLAPPDRHGVRRVGQPRGRSRGLRLRRGVRPLRQRHRPGLPADPGRDLPQRHPVLYVEPAKWVAKLRATADDRRPDVLLRTEMAAGHGGVSGRYQSWKDRAFTLAWILDRLGLA